MNTQMDSISNKIAGLQSQITDTQADIDKLSEEMDLLSADIEEQYNNMKLRIKFMYENISNLNVNVIESDLIKITKRYVKHNAEKLAELIMKNI